ncbi:MAG: hypothetical protein WDN10_04605 [bacterium]
MATQSTVFTVTQYAKRPRFRQGELNPIHVDCLLPFVLGAGARVRIIRNHLMFDTGSVRWEGGIGGRRNFCGLGKLFDALPDSCAVIKTTRLAPMLAAEWFEPDDVVKLEISPAAFRAHYHAEPGRWRM